MCPCATAKIRVTVIPLKGHTSLTLGVDIQLASVARVKRPLLHLLAWLHNCPDPSSCGALQGPHVKLSGWWPSRQPEGFTYSWRPSAIVNTPFCSRRTYTCPDQCWYNPPQKPHQPIPRVHVQLKSIAAGKQAFAIRPFAKANICVGAVPFKRHTSPALGVDIPLASISKSQKGPLNIRLRTLP
jgi:hypothetical protein